MALKFYFETPVLQVQVNVDSQGSMSSTFMFTCYGVPAKSTQMELVRGEYRPVADLYQGRKIKVAFNQWSLARDISGGYRGE